MKIKTLTIWLPLAVVVLTFFGLSIVYAWHGPTAPQAYRQFFGEWPPDEVEDLRIKYWRHLKGYAIYLSFQVDPEQLDSILEFDLLQVSPLYIEEADYHDWWQNEISFRELYADDFPDRKTLSRYSVQLQGEMREFVFSPETGHVFCYKLIDSDIDR